MPTIDVTKGSAAALPYEPASALVKLSNVVDFSKTPAAALDLVKVLNVPKDCLVLRAGYRVITPEGGTAAGTLGDEVDPDGYVAAGNFNAAAGTVVMSALALTEGTPNTVTGYSNGKLYAAGDTIDWTNTNALDTAVIEFIALAVQV